MYDSRHDPFRVLVTHVVSLHCVRLAWTCLAVCHYCTVEPVQDVLQHWPAHLLEHILLCWCCVEREVEHEGHFVLLFNLRVSDDELSLVGDPVQFLGMGFELFFIKWTKSAVNLDVSLFFLHGLCQFEMNENYINWTCPFLSLIDK